MSDGTFEMPSASWLTSFLLLDLREQDRYGHELTQRIADFGLETSRPEAMYRVLQQMEGDGMIVSEPGGSNRLPRRTYSITEIGKTYLELWANKLAQYQEEIDLFFELYAKKTAVKGQLSRPTLGASTRRD